MIPPRLAGFDYRGCHRYSLTCCVSRRQPIFRDPGIVEACKAALTTSSQRHGFRVLIYCFMPDHLHALVEGTRDNSDFRRFAKSFRRRSGHTHRARVQMELWQPGYWDRVLRTSEDTASAIRYIANNPVRAGLVASPLDHAFTGSDVMDLAELLVDVGIHAAARRG